MPHISPGLLSLVGLAVFVGLVVAAVVLLAGLGWALLAAGVLGGLACFAAELVLLDEKKEPGRG
jgi:hypothetical protein